MSAYDWALDGMILSPSLRVGLHGAGEDQTQVGESPKGAQLDYF